MNTVKKNRERGNVLFLILIAVVLFAGLGFAVSNILQSGNPTTIAGEQVRVYTNEVLDYARTVRQTVQTLRISNGCRDTEISFENPVESGYTNPNSPGDNSCHVFDTAGGGLNWITPNERILDSAFSASTRYGEWYYPRGTCIFGVGDDGTETGECDTNPALNEELMIALPFVRQEVCEAINENFNIPSPPPSETTCTVTPSQFVGSYTGSCELGDEATALIGQQTGCVHQLGFGLGDADSYTFYATLIVR